MVTHEDKQGMRAAQVPQAGLGNSSHHSLKSHLCCWAGSELFGGVALPFTHVESTFSKIAGAGDKDDLSASIAPQIGLISKWRYLDSLAFAQFSTESLTVGRQLSVEGNST